MQDDLVKLYMKLNNFHNILDKGVLTLDMLLLPNYYSKILQ